MPRGRVAVATSLKAKFGGVVLLTSIQDTWTCPHGRMLDGLKVLIIGVSLIFKADRKIERREREEREESAANIQGVSYYKPMNGNLILNKIE